MIITAVPYENCQWVGSPPLCNYHICCTAIICLTMYIEGQDNACAIGQVQICESLKYTSILSFWYTFLFYLLCDSIGSTRRRIFALSGWRSQSLLLRSRWWAFCRLIYNSDSKQTLGSNFIPVPFDDVFPDNVPTFGSETFTVDIDQDMGTSQSGSAEAIDMDEPSSDGPAGKCHSVLLLANCWTFDVANIIEETEAFGEIFIDSPNPASVSSMTLETNWVIVGCNATSDQPQSVRLHPPTWLS